MSTQQNHGFTSPLRYPGGKGALSNFIKMTIAQNKLLDGDYVEVYAGGAGAAWPLLFEEYVRAIHINDINRAVMAFWHAALHNTDEFCRMVRETPVTMEEWQRQRLIQEDQQGHSQLELGFSTFFLNRTNRSGILKGGVIGGKEQLGEWKIDARFNKDDLIRRIQRLSRYRGRIHLYTLDAVEFIQTILPTLPQKTLVYLDPPYFKKGQDLYENHYHHEDHAQIANLVVRQIRQPWIVSYDAAPEIMALYDDQQHICYKINYSAQERYAGAEVIFHSNNLRLPQVPNPTAVKMPDLMKPLF